MVIIERREKIIREQTGPPKLPTRWDFPLFRVPGIRIST